MSTAVSCISAAIMQTTPAATYPCTRQGSIGKSRGYANQKHTENGSDCAKKFLALKLFAGDVSCLEAFRSTE